MPCWVLSFVATVAPDAVFSSQFCCYSSSRCRVQFSVVGLVLDLHVQFSIVFSQLCIVQFSIMLICIFCSFSLCVQGFIVWWWGLGLRVQGFDLCGWCPCIDIQVFHISSVIKEFTAHLNLSIWGAAPFFPQVSADEPRRESSPP
jgi:hypothetical protein